MKAYVMVNWDYSNTTVNGVVLDPDLATEVANRLGCEPIEFDVIEAIAEEVPILTLTTRLDAVDEEDTRESITGQTPGLIWDNPPECRKGQPRVTPVSRWNMVTYVEFSTTGTDHAKVRKSHTETRAQVKAQFDLLVAQAELAEEARWAPIRAVDNTLPEGSYDVAWTPDRGYETVLKVAAWVPVTEEVMEDAQEMKAAIENEFNTVTVTLEDES